MKFSTLQTLGIRPNFRLAPENFSQKALTMLKFGTNILHA
ncbi:hypothetical protein EJ73_01602 [Hoylesella shahii DSM 15611 = JCM 12083]|uniref:Uncharacterized protein n=1 Tax=Hoylesella shahii DSM 15611 = JCM 12083 TaxID=1122991 RepID=A0A318I1X0_9BACT|nr:hypothetical protein EJ73_01602 [Hoylesella shahii DSM 15611 = JCM 12083]